MSTFISTAVLDQYNSATHSIIKEFVLAEGLTEMERLARITVLHAVMDADGDNEFVYYVEKLLSILLERNLKPADVKACKEAVGAVHKLRISELTIVENFQLNEYGMSLIQSIAEAIALVTPERYLPMHNCTQAPNFGNFTTMNIEGTATVKTNLVKNGMQVSRERSPKLFAGLDKLWSQQYALNEDIMTLHNLDADTDTKEWQRQIQIAASPAFAGTFSFRYTLDHRGRAYARSMYAQPQGDSFSKAVLNLGIKKPLGEKGFTALCIHYANVAGQDKLSLQARKDWAINDGMGIALHMMEAEGDWAVVKRIGAEFLGVNLNKPGQVQSLFETYAAACEFYRATVADNTQAYESSLVCHQDATNSGFQFGAALLGDLATAEATNLLKSHYTEPPKDLYKMVADSMLTHIAPAALAAWKPYINRTSLKKVVMVTGYGAGVVSQMEAFIYGLNKVDGECMIESAGDVEEALQKALEDNTAALLRISSTMKVHAKSTCENITWVTEDGFMVKHAYTEELAYGSGKYKVIDRSHTDVDESKLASALPPNFIHSIDGNMLRKAAAKSQSLNIAFVPIHDSFGTHACDFFDLGRVLREAFISVMDYNWYTAFCQDNQFKTALTILDEFNLTEARASTYMFS